jgi:hypothetical protein
MIMERIDKAARCVHSEIDEVDSVFPCDEIHPDIGRHRRMSRNLKDVNPTS